MKRIHAVGLALLLGGLTSVAGAQDVHWRPAGKQSSPSTPAASLGRPVPPKSAPTPASAIADPQLRPVLFQAASRPPGPRVARMQGEESQPPLPEPEWPADDEPKTKEKEESPKKEPAPSATTPLPTFPPPTVVAPAVPSAPQMPCGVECFPAGPPFGGRLYGSAEYLLWWIRDAPIPPLVTTSPVASQGILGLPGTTVLFGGQNANLDERGGGRFALGYWFDPCCTWAVEGSFFFLGERAGRFGATSDQFALLGRPFFNLNTGTEFSEIVTDPNRAFGGIGILLPSQLWGYEANLRKNVCRGCGGYFDLIGGFRYLDLHEGVNILEMGTVLPGGGPFAGSMFSVFDTFNTRNQFYGGNLGAETELRRGRWFVNLRGKVALGVNHQTVSIVGGQAITAPDGTVSRFRGGLLALPSNIGTFKRDDFAVVPEAGINVGCQIIGGLRAYVGYTFLYWTDVLRPGNQIDRVLNVNQIPNFMPGPPSNQIRPVVPFRDSNFWAQGINFGLEWRY
jgi:hypothetical protein